MPKEVKKFNCDTCEDGALDQKCQECCDHDYDPGEGFICLNCDKDGHEMAMGRAYDEAKDLLKYGE